MVLGTIPQFDVDLFSDDVLTDPYPHYRTLRDAGPVVYLAPLDMPAFPRYAQVRAALADWRTFSSAEGVGFGELFNEMSRGNVLATDPPEHTRLRGILNQWLSPRRIRSFHAVIEQRAEELVASLLERGTFDAVTDLAVAFPALIVTDLVGLSEDRRDRILAWGEATFNVVGPHNERAESAFPVMMDLQQTLSSLAPEDLKPGSMGREALEAVAANDLAPDDGFQLLWDMVGPSIHTTVSAMSTAIHQLTETGQWELLRRDTAFVHAACEEALRFEAPLPLLTRVTQQEWDADGVMIEPGVRVAMLLGSANRDERQFSEPDRFNIERSSTDHVGFGFGIHSCVGASLARAEIEAVLRALSSRAARIEVGEPVGYLNNGARGLQHLPTRLSAA